MRALLLCCASLLVVLFASTPARADAPELRTRISADTVAVGETLSLQLGATVTGNEMPSDPSPGATTGFTVRGTSTAPSSQMIIRNGVRTDRVGLTATWSLRADKPGTFVLGPPSVKIGGKRFSGQSVRVVVVRAGQPVPNQGGRGGAVDPMDPWKGLFSFDFGDEPFVALPNLGVPTDPALSLDAPRGVTAFLHATIDKTRAVVGEQVTLTVLLYVDAEAREPDFTDVHEAPAPDFLKRALMDEGQARVLGAARVGDRIYLVKALRKSALFPLKTGALEIGPMEVSLTKSRGALKRESERLTVQVTEPPAAGRPPGYTVGDVGKFELTSEVSPREVDQGGAVGVTVDLTGTGNLPAQLPVPARQGVTWLTPEVHDKIGPVKGTEKIGGRRTFTYVVSLAQSGQVDLGELALPYWDPDARAYGVARTRLGTVQVKGGTVPIVSAPRQEILPGMPAVVASLSPPVARGANVLDAGAFWAALVLLPLAYPVVAGARAAAQWRRSRKAERASDPRTEMQGRRAEAEAAARGKDGRALDAAAARALEASLVSCVHVNLRGVTSRAARDELEARGLSASDAKALLHVYEACQAARFSPDETPIDDARTRWKEARALLDALPKAPRGLHA